jgi:integral membrane sensor domain MASE1
MFGVSGRTGRPTERKERTMARIIATVLVIVLAVAAFAATAYAIATAMGVWFDGGMMYVPGTAHLEWAGIVASMVLLAVLAGGGEIVDRYLP